MRMSRPDTHGSTRSRGRADTYDPVLTAKVTVPDLPGWAVARPRIDKLIADGTRGPLTLVAGPPGAGKTMAIAAWAAASCNPAALAWLTVDGRDNRPRVFWSYVVAALRRAGVAVPRVRFGPGRVAVDHAFLANLASALAAHDPPVVLVLDDTTPLGPILARIAAFFRDESCGQCVPCRVGTVRQEELVSRLVRRRPLGSVDAERHLLDELGQAMRDASICGLGQTASSAVVSGLALTRALEGS